MVNEKKGLTIDEQIIRLKEKNIVFKNEEEEKEAKEYLLKYSYTDVINPLKVLFCSSYDKCHQYEYKTNWSDIQRLHEDVKKLETELFKRVMQLELEIKSKLCNYIASEINSNDTMNFKKFLENLETKTTINSTKNFYQINEDKYNKLYSRDYNDYNDTNFVTRWYLLIMSLNIGELATILKAKYNNETIDHKIGFGDFKLVEFRFLRNSLAHGTSLLIFLDKPLRKNKNKNNNTEYKNRKELLYSIISNSDEMNIDENGIINEYSNIRNNPKKKRGKFTFKKYKI